MLKQLKIFLCCLLFATCLNAQTNLVPNGSFENYTTCPNGLDQMSYCVGWSSYRLSPDYFNTCSSVSGLAPPYSAVGYQQPLFGNAYAGIASYDNTGLGPNSREIIGAQLTSNLQIGVKYYFSVFVSFSGIQSFELAMNKIGIRFSTITYSFSNPAPINNYSHFYCQNIITDTLNWTQIKGSCIADSNYKYFALGVFYDDANVDTLSTGPYNQLSYYYLDNVCLSTDSNYAYTNGIDYLDESNNKIEAFPNPCGEKLNVDCKNCEGEIELLDFQMLTAKKAVVFNKSPWTIDTSELSNGLYFLKYSGKNKNFYKRIIISK